MAAKSNFQFPLLFKLGIWSNLMFQFLEKIWFKIGEPNKVEIYSIAFQEDELENLEFRKGS